MSKQHTSVHVTIKTRMHHIYLPSISPRCSLLCVFTTSPPCRISKHSFYLKIRAWYSFQVKLYLFFYFLLHWLERGRCVRAWVWRGVCVVFTTVRRQGVHSWYLRGWACVCVCVTEGKIKRERLFIYGFPCERGAVRVCVLGMGGVL